MKTLFRTIVLIAILLAGAGAARGQAVEARRPHFWQSRTFWKVLAIDSLAMVGDYAAFQATPARAVHEQDPLFGSRRPSMPHMIAIGEPFAFAAAIASEKLREDHKRWWWAPVAADVAEHTALMFKNISLADARAPSSKQIPMPPRIRIPR